MHLCTLTPNYASFATLSSTATSGFTSPFLYLNIYLICFSIHRRWREEQKGHSHFSDQTVNLFPRSFEHWRHLLVMRIIDTHISGLFTELVILASRGCMHEEVPKWVQPKHRVGLVEVSNKSQVQSIRTSAWFPLIRALPRAQHRWSLNLRLVYNAS